MARPELKSKMTLDTRGFQRGLRRVRRLGQNFGRKFGQPIAQATGALVKLGAIAATVTAAGVFLAVKKVAELGDQMDKMSKRTGIGTDELSRLAFAAELSGTGIESLEKAVKRMAAVILDGEQGLKTATDSFDALGIKMEDVSNKTPEEQLNVFLEALAGVENASTRAALAQEIFGRAGTQLLPMLSDGVEGLKKMKAEADKLGIVITPEQAASAAELVDEVTRLKKSFLGLLLSAIKLGTVTPVIRKMTAVVVKFRDSAKFREITAAVAAFVRETVSRVGRWINAWNAVDSDTRQALKRMAIGFASFIILWKSGFIGPFTRLLFNLAAGVAATLPLIVTNFVVMQGGLAAAAKGVKGIMLSMLKAILVPLAVIAAIILGFSLGEAIETAFDLSGAFLRIKAKINGFKDQMVALWKLTGLEQAAAVNEINERIIKELEDISKVSPKAPGFKGFGKAIEEEFEKNIQGIAKIFDKLKIPGVDALKEIFKAFKGAKEIKVDNIDAAAKGLRDMADQAGNARREISGINQVVRGFNIGKEKILRQAARIKTLGPAVGAATREALGLPAKAVPPGARARIDPKDVLRVGGAQVDRRPGITPFTIPPVILDRVRKPIESIGALNRKQLREAETTNTKLTAILQQKRVLGWAD